MAGDIVEDATNDATVYQRVGRKPAIVAVIDAFVARVAANAAINGFFGGTDIARLKTCLVRQVCSIDGPCRYGQEVDGEAGVSAATPCRDMVASHAGLLDADENPITIDDFNALVGDLVAVLDEFSVPMAEKDALLGALGPMCPMIVAGGTGCP